MRNYLNKVGLIIMLMTIGSLANAATYTIQRQLSTSKAAAFWNKPLHGFKFHDTDGMDFYAHVKVESANNISFLYSPVCINLPIYHHNEPLIMYETEATDDSPSDGSGFIHDYDDFYGRGNPYYYYSSIKSPVGYCRSNSTRPDQRGFFKNQALTARWSLPRPYNWIIDQKITVNITITLTGDLKLTDLAEIKIPGVDPIYWHDFIKKIVYDPDHACGTANYPICNTYNDIRSIPDLNATDMKIQAHRGIWGKTNQENTIGAMAEAVTQGYPLLESDIMPFGVTNLTNPLASDFGKPSGLAAYHDFDMARYSDGTGYILERDYTYLKNVKLMEPRSNVFGDERILFYASKGYGEDNLPIETSGLLGFAAFRHDRGLLIDMKTIESFGSNPCQLFCEFTTQERKNISLFHNIALAIEKAKISGYLRYLTFKTYLTYDALKQGLLNVGVSESDFNKVLWAPILADKASTMNPADAKAYLDGWFLHNESVLYYETNFFVDHAPLLNDSYCITGQECYNVMEYIWRMSGRRAGIFSEEPVGGKGTVDRWNRWTIKDPAIDRRGDHLWLLKQPFFKHAVITTDRPDVWKQLND